MDPVIVFVLGAMAGAIIHCLAVSGSFGKQAEELENAKRRIADAKEWLVGAGCMFPKCHGKCRICQARKALQ